jgi:F-type H+-transporting ATPase subunit delta
MTHSGDPHPGPQPDATSRAGPSLGRQETVLDVNTQRIAKVYAEALLAAADKQGQADEIREELDELAGKFFEADPRAQAFLTSGAISRSRKAEVIRNVFSGRASELFVNFLLVLNDQDRTDLLRAVGRAYGELCENRAGRVRVQVRSAVPLADDQRTRLVEQLRTTFGKEPVLDTRVEPDLLGGMVVRVGDWLYDYSLRSRLEDLRNQLIARSSHEIQSQRDRFRS